MTNPKLLFLGVAMALSLSALAQREIPNITDPRLDFTLPTLKGDSIALSSMKGKVVLVDFWASWCLPCRVANKHLVKLYAKYKDKGFEIFGVSLDDDRADWRKAVSKDKITWKQVNDNRGWDAVSAMKWNVQALPSSFLVNQNGDVVAIDLERTELEKKVKELLGF